MKQSLQRKISAHRQAKSTRQSFQGFMQEKKKTLKSLMQQQSLQQQQQNTLFQLQKQNKYSLTSQFTKNMGVKQQQYFRQVQELQKLQLHTIDKMNVLRDLEMQVELLRKSYGRLEQAIKKEREQNEQLIDQISSNQTDEITKTAQVYKQRHKTNLEHYEQLINAKQQQNQVIMNFLNKKKKFEKDQKQLKQNHEKALKDNKKLWAQQQQQSRQKWQKQKKQQITQNTLKGIEPQIQRIVSSSKSQIRKIQEKYEILKQQYRLSLTKQYQKRATQMRNQSFSLIEQQKMKVLSEYSQKLAVQFQTLQEQFEKDRKKIRAQREEQIRLLEDKRKNQTEDFIINNKDFYTIHLQQVKAIKQEYEQQIRQLDGKYELDIQKQEHLIRVKYNDRLQKERQLERKELQQKIKKFTVQYEKQTQVMYEDLVEKVAVENDVYESRVRAKVEEKIKEIRQAHQGDVKRLKKTIQVLEGKLQTLGKEAVGKKQQREETQQALEEIKREHQYLQRKVSEYEQDLIQRKLTLQTSTDLDTHPTILSLTHQWQQQISKAKQSYLALQKQVEQSQQIMAEKIAQLRTDYSENVNMLEKNSLKLLTMKKNQLAKLKADKEMQEKYGQGLEEMIKKQKAMMERFQQQKAIVNGGKKPSVQN